MAFEAIKTVGVRIELFNINICILTHCFYTTID